MTGKTHLTGGLAAGLILERAAHLAGLPLLPALAVAGLPAAVWAFAALGLGSLLPDIDEPNSMVSNLPRVSRGLARQTLKKKGLEGLARFLLDIILFFLNLFTRALSGLVRIAAGGHRGATHWLITCLVVGFLAGLGGLTAGFPDLGFWLALGVLVHLGLDMMTVSGLEVLRPFTPLTLHLLPPGLRIRTGGVADTLLGVLFGAAAFGMFYWSMSQAVNWAALLKHIEGAMRWPF